MMIQVVQPCEYTSDGLLLTFQGGNEMVTFSAYKNNTGCLLSQVKKMRACNKLTSPIRPWPWPRQSSIANRRLCNLKLLSLNSATCVEIEDQLNVLKLLRKMSFELTFKLSSTVY